MFFEIDTRNFSIDQQLYYKGTLEAGFLIFILNQPQKIQTIFKNIKCQFLDKISTFGCSESSWEPN